MTPALWRGLAAVLVLLVLPGCTSGAGPPHREATAGSSASPAKERPEPDAGTCWTDQQVPQAIGEGAFARLVKEYARGDQRLARAMRDDAAFTDQVDCDRPHALEVYRVVTVGPRLLARLNGYADLLDESSPLFRRIRDQVNDRCAAGSAYGRAQRRVGLRVQLGPALAPHSGLHLAWDPFPPDLWVHGDHEFVCTLEQERPGTLRYADLSTARAPQRARLCLDSPGRFVPCRQPHRAEDIGEMILNTAIATGAVDARMAVRRDRRGRYVALSDREYARLDRVCRTLLDMVSTRRDGVTARAYPGSVSQWPTKQGTYVATCFALRPHDPPPKIRGSVFDKG